MRVLLDTHALIWAVDDPTQLGSEVRRALEDESNSTQPSSRSVRPAAHRSGASGRPREGPPATHDLEPRLPQRRARRAPYGVLTSRN